jgi:hypothetical protein
MKTSKKSHRIYYIVNITLNVLYFFCIVILPIPQASSVGKVILTALTLVNYMVYLIVVYHFSIILPLTKLLSMHEYQLTFNTLVNAPAYIKFVYHPPKNSVDE